MPTLKINGQVKSFDAPDEMPLLWVLRDVLGMTGTKYGCGIAQCGACTVHIDGKPVRSCLLQVGAIGNRAVTTIEGIGGTPAGARVQKAWLDVEVLSRFAGRILPITSAVADRWGLLTAEAKKKDRPLATIDALLAATALEHNFTIVTRNIRDFRDTHVLLLNPWDS